MNELTGSYGTVKRATPVRAPAIEWRAVLLLAAIAALVFLLRALYLDRSFDIFIDEITYLRIAKEVAANGRVYLYGEPFFLHPPAFFYLHAAFLNLFPAAGHTIDQVQTARYLNVGLAALSAILLFLIVARAAGRRWGLVAVALFALDPFVIRVNSRLLLETAALFWMLLGLWILLARLPVDQPARAHAPFSPLRLALAGLAFGLALLTKDMMFFLTLLPLGFLALRGWLIRRRDALLVGAVSTLPYLLYVAAAVAAGQWDLFVYEKFRGLLRLVGLIQETGINRNVGPSFIESVLLRVGEFGITYMLILMGIAALILLATRARAIDRLIALWSACAYALLAYCIVFGTLEEQFFYFLVIPCIIAVPVALAHLPSLDLSPALRRRLTFIMAALGLFFLVVGGYQWAVRHFTPDNGYEQVVAYLDATVPPGTDVASTSETGQFLLDDYLTGPWGQWNSVDALAEFGPDYLLLSTAQLEWEHGAAAQPLLDWVARNGTLVWQFEGRTAGRLLLYQLSGD